MSRIVQSGYRRLAPLLPARVAAALDWHFFPNPSRPYRDMGPLNGQRGRVRVFLKLVDDLELDAIVETGSFRGTTTVFFRHVSGLPVYTVEVSRRYFHFARRRFAGDEGIHAFCGDSRAFLGRLAADPGVAHGRVFFYLDAHWQDDLPLGEELEIISRSWSDPVVMIDDFQVPDDPTYGFDDYGAGRRLAVDYLPVEFRRDFRLFWPTLRGAEESGHRRGYVVAGRRGSAGERLEQVPLLREIRAACPAP